VIEDRAGHIYASVENGGVVGIVDEKAAPLPESQVLPFSSLNERILQDQHCDWWIGTDTGVFRFQGPELQLLRGRMLGAADGIAEAPIQGGLYEDPAGKVWIKPLREGLYVLDPARKGRVTFEHISQSDISPFSGVVRMISDRSGTLWLGAHELLGRLVNGRVEMLGPSDGLPETDPRAFFLDSRGWLWIGLRYKGVSVCKDPTAATPTFVNYSTANGLASDTVWAIAEDDVGRMYLGTGKGLDQLDLNNGRIRHFNTDDRTVILSFEYKCIKNLPDSQLKFNE
jgi:ligand-binding sensor domain-containing protein